MKYWIDYRIEGVLTTIPSHVIIETNDTRNIKKIASKTIAQSKFVEETKVEILGVRRRRSIPTVL